MCIDGYPLKLSRLAKQIYALTKLPRVQNFLLQFELYISFMRRSLKEMHLSDEKSNEWNPSCAARGTTSLIST